MKVTGIETFATYRDYTGARKGDRAGVLLRTDLDKEFIKDLMDDGYTLFLRHRVDTVEEIREARSRLREIIDEDV